jgi:protein subunit release factor B
MPVSSDKTKAITDRMIKLGVSESDFEESFIRSSGPGGQKVNKSSSCVYLIHIPTGLSVKCQRERSQSLNRFLARRLLLDKIERLQKGFIAQEKKKLEKIRMMEEE